MADTAFLSVTVCCSPGPRDVHEWIVRVTPGATVLDAIGASGLQEALPGVDLKHIAIGVWGRKARLDQLLRDFDRVELYRPLKVDPKVARRERFRRQGARSAGLFARRKPGAKAGY